MGKADDVGDPQEDAQSSLSVFDASGTRLFFQAKKWELPGEFKWQLGDQPLPPGALSLVVDVGDGDAGIHTSKTFNYIIPGSMTASNVEVPKGVELGSELLVTIAPSVVAAAGGVPQRLLNQKYGTESAELVDVSGAVLEVKDSVEAHMYLMRIKVGDVLVKEAQGANSANDNNELEVTFTTTIEHSLDFATGFTLSFAFQNAAGEVLELEGEPFSVNVTSAVHILGDPLRTGSFGYGDNVTANFRIVDSGSDGLDAGRAYPVLAFTDALGNVIAHVPCKSRDGAFVGELQIAADVPSGELGVAVLVRRGAEYIGLNGTDGKPFGSQISVAGQLAFSSVVRASGQQIVVDFVTKSGGNKMPGAAFVVDVNDGQFSIPLAQRKSGGRASFEVPKAGPLKLELRAASGGPVLHVVTLSGGAAVEQWMRKLPLEAGVLFALAGAFVWAVRVRLAVQADAKKKR